MGVIDLMLQILILAVLTLMNGFFACLEVSLISLNDAKILKMSREGNKKAAVISKMLKEPTRFLATIQIGVTLAGFLASAFAATSFADKLAPVLENLMHVSMDFWETVSIVLITIILAYITLIFGELVPKRIGMKYYEKIAFGTIGILKGIYTIFLPFVKILTASTNVISKLFGVSEEEEETVTEEEIRIMVDARRRKRSNRRRRKRNDK